MKKLSLLFIILFLTSCESLVEEMHNPICPCVVTGVEMSGDFYIVKFSGEDDIQNINERLFYTKTKYSVGDTIQ